MMRIGEFFKWWRAELAGMLPDAVRRRFARRHDTLVLSLVGDEVRIGRRLNGRSEELGRIATTAGDARQRAAAILGGSASQATRIEVMVPREKLLTKQVQLPMAAEENLRQVLGFEMQRQTPFRADEVYYNHAITERRPQTQQMAVHISLVPRTVVDGVLELVDGGELVAANAGNDANRDDAVFAFQPGDAVQRSSSHLHRGLIALNVVLLAAVIAIPFVQQQRHLEELRGRLAEVREAATTATDLQQRIDRQRARARYLYVQKSGKPASVELLEELSQRIPDDTWLFRLEMRDGRVHLQGTSTTASALIAELEGSRFLRDVRFASPVTQDGSSGRERFHLMAIVVAPEASALAGSPKDADT